jgi:hypothetical protein
MSIAGSLEQLAEALSPLDFPAGSLKVVWQDNLPIKFQLPNSCLGLTTLDLDIWCGLPADRRVVAVVLNERHMPYALIGTLLHQLAHAIELPPLDTRGTTSAGARTITQRFGEELMAEPARLDRYVGPHNISFARILTHLFFRARVMGLWPTHFSSKVVWHPLFVESLLGDVMALQGRSLREASAQPWSWHFYHLYNLTCGFGQ